MTRYLLEISPNRIDWMKTRLCFVTTAAPGSVEEQAEIRRFVARATKAIGWLDTSADDSGRPTGATLYTAHGALIARYPVGAGQEG